MTNELESGENCGEVRVQDNIGINGFTELAKSGSKWKKKGFKRTSKSLSRVKMENKEQDAEEVSLAKDLAADGDFHGKFF